MSLLEFKSLVQPNHFPGSILNTIHIGFLLHAPVYISGAEVEQVNSFRFLGISITKNLSWSSYISTLVKKAQKWQNFLKKLKITKFPCAALVNFYTGTVERFLADILESAYMLSDMKTF